MILITGLTGTSGSAFYKVLCENKFKEKIRVVARKSTDLSIFDKTPLDLEVVMGDVEDIVFMKKAIEGVRLIFHIAAKDKSQKIVDAVCDSVEKPDVCMVSSTIVYSNYYRTSYLKKDEGTYIQRFKENNIRYVFIRPTMIFGLPTDRNISVFVRWINKYPFFPMVKKGKPTIQPVHRNDLAQAYWLVLSNFDNLKNNEYIVSGKDEMSLLDMFKTISDVIGTKTNFINIPFPLAKFAVNLIYAVSIKRIDYREKLDRLTENRAYSHDAIQKELGYIPLSFEERLRQTIDEYSDYI